MSSNILEEVRKERVTLCKLAKEYGAYNLRIFGSSVRGEVAEGSDVDFLVDMEEDRSMFDLMKLEAELSKYLERPVDVVTESSLNRHIRERVLLEAQKV